MKKNEIESDLSSHKRQIDALWSWFERDYESDLKNHKRICDLESLVLGLSDEFKKLHKTVGQLSTALETSNNQLWKQDEVIGNIMRVLKQSGIVEEAVNGDDLFQMINTTDRLQRNPLYKINKVVTK